MRKYVIVGEYIKTKRVEQLDSFDDFKAAITNLVTYQIAYGDGWKIDLKFTIERELSHDDIYTN